MKRYAFKFPFIECTLEWTTPYSINIASIRKDLQDKQILIGYTLYDNKVYEMEYLLSNSEYQYCCKDCIDIAKIKEVLNNKIKVTERFKKYMNDLVELDLFPWLLYSTSLNGLSFYYVGSNKEVLLTSLNKKDMSIHFNKSYNDLKEFKKYLEGCGVTVTYEEKIELYKEACRTYAIGEEILTDKEFNSLENELKLLGYNGVNKRYEDIDDIETDISDSGYSIEPLGDWESIYTFVRNSTNKTLIFTLKYDGVHCKNVTGQNFSSQSRSSGNPIDYTKTMKLILPSISERHLIMGEVFLQDKYLEYFRNKYDSNKYKLPRTSAVSLLRLTDNHDIEDLKKLSFIAYNTDKKFDLKSNMFKWFEDIGLVSPQYYLYTFNGAETDELIQITLRDIMRKLDIVDIPSDGIVMEYNDLSIVPDINSKYLSTQSAIKVDKWGLTYYTSKVLDCNITQKKGALGAVLVIEPVIISGVTIRNVNAYNPAIILNEKIEKGSLIRFIRKSNGMCYLAYGGDIK